MKCRPVRGAGNLLTGSCADQLPLLGRYESLQYQRRLCAAATTRHLSRNSLSAAAASFLGSHSEDFSRW